MIRLRPQHELQPGVMFERHLPQAPRRSDTAMPTSDWRKQTAEENSGRSRRKQPAHVWEGGSWTGQGKHPRPCVRFQVEPWRALEGEQERRRRRRISGRQNFGGRIPVMPKQGDHRPGTDHGSRMPRAGHHPRGVSRSSGNNKLRRPHAMPYSKANQHHAARDR